MTSRAIQPTNPMPDAELAIRASLEPDEGKGAMERLFAEYDARKGEARDAFVAALIGRVVVSHVRDRGRKATYG